MNAMPVIVAPPAPLVNPSSTPFPPPNFPSFPPFSPPGTNLPPPVPRTSRHPVLARPSPYGGPVASLNPSKILWVAGIPTTTHRNSSLPPHIGH